jgi:hypothetical protein
MSMQASSLPLDDLLRLAAVVAATPAAAAAAAATTAEMQTPRHA